MLKMFRAGRSSILIWGLMGLLFVGLAGFGIGAGALASREIASVGGRDVTADAYASALDQEMRAIGAQIGRALTMEEARQFGVDRMVLARMVGDAALDVEAERLGLSSSDDIVRAQVEESPTFRGSSGGFDADTYRYALDRAGLTPAEFEALIRDEATREMIAEGVQSAVTMPDSAALAVLDYLGEERRFDWVRLGAEALEQPVAPPSESVVAKFYSENGARYTRPETRRITYARLSPQALAETIEIPEDDMRAVYDADPERFGTPEQRFIDRIGFGSIEEAQAARDRIEAGESDFDALASERGLSAAEIDQGAVRAADLAPEAREAVFAVDGPGLVGPVQTPLGPSLFRVNAITAGKTTPFEEARDEIAQERALTQARDQITSEAATLEDLVAGGATVEEIAAETVMELGTIELNTQSVGDLAVDPAFRELAGTARVGEETDLANLGDGGMIVLRVEEVEPPQVIALDEIRDRVAEDWVAAETTARLTTLAENWVEKIEGGETLGAVAAERDLAVQGAGPLARGDTVPGLPPALIANVFASDAVVGQDVDGVIVAHVTAIEPFDPEAEVNAAMLDTVRTQLRDQAAEDVLALYTAALRDTAGVSVNEDLIESTLAQFP